ncbi:unnamed protein product (macronuclear) [Paramecium tetraurelia]|uniref:Uncharacterized protein n=1 Tax=Paramecium tetraurelia TaxID=5888 RepID=A0C5L0_PARTE|nr:uncharacterized protein GSPATT00035206001 [Paramecium tetraurelia]CAK66077.1 unnamed protein product [Paramecium tetraurelia]|eukprot:XP_001433474.1 hypothetical protein (macronuclear) [Paramecium tetraurelia strain d4-2]
MEDEEICQNIQQGDCSKSVISLRESFNDYPSFQNPFKLHNEKYLKLSKLLEEKNESQEVQKILEEGEFNQEDEYYAAFQKIEENYKENNFAQQAKPNFQTKVAYQLTDEYLRQLKSSQLQLFGLIYSSNKINENIGHFLILKNQQIESILNVQQENEVTSAFKENELTKLCAILGCDEFFNEEREKQVASLSLKTQLYLLKFNNQRGLVSCQNYVNGVASPIGIQEITVRHFEGVRQYWIKQ